jgi:hypothetical protein
MCKAIFSGAAENDEPSRYSNIFTFAEAFSDSRLQIDPDDLAAGYGLRTEAMPPRLGP